MVLSDRMIGYCHHAVVCLSVCLSVCDEVYSRPIAAKWYILQQKCLNKLIENAALLHDFTTFSPRHRPYPFKLRTFWNIHVGVIWRMNPNHTANTSGIAIDSMQQGYFRQPLTSIGSFSCYLSADVTAAQIDRVDVNSMHWAYAAIIPRMQVLFFPSTLSLNRFLAEHTRQN